MFNEDIINEINRIKFEDFLWIIFAILAIANIYGDYNEIEFLKANNNEFKSKANHVFVFTLIISLLIYLYFFSRNYNDYKKVSEDKKKLYEIKLLGSSLLIAGIICLIYFQINQTSFTGSPAI